MSIKAPTSEQVRSVSEDLGLSLDAEDIEEFGSMMAATLHDYYAKLDTIPDYLPGVTWPRTAGRRPSPDEDPLHAWYVKTKVKGAGRGKLAGREVVLKDNICLAGVPMMNGSSTLDGYVPDVDATVVNRILDAGGDIMGKANCEYFCFSGGSHTNATGATHNPRKPGHSAGGSSSGCAALVADGQAEMAIGGDQGGSIRVPASFCGIYGMKATHGLVPYTGVMPIELTLDHVGPMTATVADNALLLEVIAGADGLDPRQYAPQTSNYTEALGQPVRGLRIGVLEEGFDWPHSQPDVDECVRMATEQFRSLGARVEPVSVPLHRLGMSIWLPMGVEGATELMMKGNGLGTNWRGLYVTSLLDAHRDWRSKADSLSEILKLGLLLGQYMHRYFGGHYYAKAQNLSRLLREAYDEVLSRFDLLVMPTSPIKPPKLPPSNPTREESMSPGFDPITNTAPFDATGHPAMNVPCGTSEGLPVGMMLVGRYWEETTLYRAAHAFEQSVDWTRL